MKTKACLHHSVIPQSITEQYPRVVGDHKNRGYGLKSAYHFFIESDGKLKEGRSVHLPSFASGSLNVNLTHIHICLAGNFENEKPTSGQINMLKRLLKARGITEVIGHKDASPTKCPGKNLYKMLPMLIIPDWAEETVQEMQEAGISTTPTERVGNLPLYQLVLLIKKMLKFWGLIK